MTSNTRKVARELAIVIATALALVAPRAIAQVPPSDACVPNDNAVHPTMDGKVGNGVLVAGFTDDPGWTGASVLGLQDVQGTVASTLSLLKLKSTSSALYLGAVLQDGQIKDANTVLLGVEVTNGSTVVSSWKFLINPFTAAETGGAAYSSHDLFTSVHYAKYWTNPADFTNSGAAQDIPSTSWLGQQGAGGDFGFVFSKDTDGVTDGMHPGRWSLELKIPRVASAADNTIAKGIFFGSGAGNQVHIYFNVLTTDSLLAPSTSLYEQYPWPRATMISDGGALVETKMPPLTDWATLTLDTQCGVSLSASKVGVLKGGSITTTIDKGQSAAFVPADCTSSDPAIYTTNTLVAVPSSNQPMAANMVINFDVTGFGIPGSTFLTHIATKNVTIPANSPLQVTSDWGLTKSEVCKLVTNGPDHQCFRVNMTSTNATVLTPSIFNNLYWGHSSSFADNAQIDTSDLPKPASGKHRILLRVSDHVLSEQSERELDAGDLHPPLCSEADPLSGSDYCGCVRDVNTKLRGLPGDGAVPGEVARRDVVSFHDAEINRACGNLIEKAQATAKTRQYQTLHRIVKAYGIIDKRLNIHGSLYREAKYMGAYAYLVRHFLEGSRDQVDVAWRLAELGGPGLQLSRVQADGSLAVVEPSKFEPGGAGMLVRNEPETQGVVQYAQYVLDVPPGKPVSVTTGLDTKEGPKGSFGGKVPPVPQCCPSQGVSSTALPPPKEVKFAGLFLTVLAAARIRSRRWRANRRRE